MANNEDFITWLKVRHVPAYGFNFAGQINPQACVFGLRNPDWV